MKMSWDRYTDLGRPALNQELVAKSVTVSTDGIAYTGCTVMCGGVDNMWKLMIPSSVLVRSDITLRTANGKPVTVLGAIPVMVMVVGSSPTQSRRSSKLSLSCQHYSSASHVSKILTSSASPSLSLSILVRHSRP